MSVIIPAYNAGPFVGDAINTIPTQSHQIPEVILVDDGSTSTFLSQRAKARFIRSSLEVQGRGGDLSWQELADRYHPFPRQRYDWAYAWHRIAGLSVPEWEWSESRSVWFASGDVRASLHIQEVHSSASRF